MKKNSEQNNGEIFKKDWKFSDFFFMFMKFDADSKVRISGGLINYVKVSKISALLQEKKAQALE